jgi:hypothetical protein
MDILSIVGFSAMNAILTGVTIEGGDVNLSVNSPAFIFCIQRHDWCDIITTMENIIPLPIILMKKDVFKLPI